MSESVTQGNHQLDGINRKTIISEIEKSRNAVISDLEKLGINTSTLNFKCQVSAAFEEDLVDPDCELDSELESDSEENDLQHEELGAELIDIEAEEEDQQDINFLSGITGELMLRDYSVDQDKDQESYENTEGHVDLSEKNRLLLVTDNSGKWKVVRKSAVIYVLSKDKHKLSSDRLQRIQEKEYTMNVLTNKAIPDADRFIGLGDWCIFCERLGDKIGPRLIGLVLGFTYLNGNTFKEREYTKSFAKVQSNNGVGVLCCFYNFDEAGILSNVSDDKHKFLEIGSYMGTIRKPSYENRTLCISQNLVLKIHHSRVH